MKQGKAVSMIIMVALSSACSGNAGSGGSAGSAGTMQPGKWQMTTEVLDMKVNGMPPGIAVPKPAPVTTSVCITPDQANAGPGNMMAKSTPDCTVSKSTNADGKIAIEMSCKTPAGPVTTKIDGTYSATETVMTSESVTPGEHGATTKSRITSKRVGDCG